MILDDIVLATKQRVDQSKTDIPLQDLVVEAVLMPVEKEFVFENALRAQDFNFICEVKKASPSKGIIVEDFPYLDIAKEYERAGAAAISVLTEPDFFKGAPQYLYNIAREVRIPVLRKDFIIDEYQIYEAKLWGASAILLICAILDVSTLTRFRELADSLGLSCLVEAHDEEEIHKALACGARIIGVNNRNLKDFTVNVRNSLVLRHLVPDDIIFVSESGLETPEDIQILRDNNVSVALMGETFMRALDKTAMLAHLYGPVKGNKAMTNGQETNENIESPTKIKLCGIMDLETIPTLVKTHPDYIGFIFAPSKRHVTPEVARELVKVLRKEEKSVKSALDKAPNSDQAQGTSIGPIQTVGVFVNESIETILDTAAAVGLDVFQLHGDEDETFIKELKKKTSCQVWKATAVRTEKDVVKWNDTVADLVLFDTYVPGVRGGSGQCFDWADLANVSRPFAMAGGLSVRNIARAIRTARPTIVDISSGIETSGKQDVEKIEDLMGLVRKVLQ